MKKFLIFSLSILFCSSVFAHSGGTDSNGCHAGSQPYHCHNGGNFGGSTGGSSGFADDASLGVDAWDLNIGVKIGLDGKYPIPYLGFSIGREYGSDEETIGADMGLVFSQGIHFGLVSTTQSFQIGYRFWHVSLSSESIGFGLRYPHSVTQTSRPSFYMSGTGLYGYSSSN